MRFALIPLVLLIWILAFSACSQQPPTSTPIPIPTPTPISGQITFKVAAGGSYEIPFDVRVGTEITYRFTADLDVDFRIIDPYDNLLRQASRVESANGSIVAKDEGRHRFIFDNTFSLVTSKTIDLNYVVKR